MASLTAAQRQRQRVAALTRHRPDSPETAEARRDLAAVKLEEYVARVLADAPPLTDGQRRRIAGLLRPPRPVEESPARLPAPGSAAWLLDTRAQLAAHGIHLSSAAVRQRYRRFQAEHIDQPFVAWVVELEGRRQP